MPDVGDVDSYVHFGIGAWLASRCGGDEFVLPESFLLRPQINKSSDLCFVCFVVLLLV